MIIYRCGHCDKEGLPSVWQYKYKDGKIVSLITECANYLRFHSRNTINSDTYTIIEGKKKD